MKKNNNKDRINILILISLFLIMVLFLTKFKFLYGSVLDWETQHWTFAEYFRILFYKTHNLFPSFAFNIGAGENIYNFSYYGLLNPIVLISYLLPFIKMVDYIMLTSILSIIASIILFYKWLKNNNNSSFLCFIGTLLLLVSGPLIFHSHRHIMFVNYMPFLILGLMSIDKYFKEKIRYPLIISVFLIIMTSYYYSIPSLIVLVIYGIYVYVRDNLVTIKGFFTDGFKFLMPIITGILLASVILLPTLYTLFIGRSSNTVSIEIKELLLPSINLNYMLYGSYSMGLTAISVLSIIYGFISKKKENIFASSIISIFILFPIFGYILNGFLYINAKVFIPFIPLIVFMICIFLNDLFKNKIDIKKLIIITVILSICAYLFGYKTTNYYIDISITLLMLIWYYFKKFKWGLIISTTLTGIIVMISLNVGDTLMSIKDYNYIFNKDIDKLYESINNKNIYRSSNLVDSLVTSNKTYDNYYGTSTYSSGYNSYYKDFYTNIFANPISHRNHMILGQIDNPLWNTYMGIKYIVNDKKMNEYKEYDTKGNYTLYENELVYPLGYARKEIMSKKEYESLDYPINIEALFKYTIVDKNIENTNFKGTAKEYNIDLSNIDIDYKLKNNHYIFKLNNSKNIKIALDKKLDNQVLLIRFNMNYEETCKNGDTTITINGVKNTLTCRSWKYKNNNNTFDYVLYNPTSLDIELSKGKFDISDIKTFILDYDTISNEIPNLDVFMFNKDKTIGDTITGNITVKNNSYFSLSIPYDKGFKIFVDNKEINYELVNTSFIGFPINKGKHNIKIVYKSPLKDISLMLSIGGLIILIIYIVLDKRGKNERIN